MIPFTFNLCYSLVISWVTALLLASWFYFDYKQIPWDDLDLPTFSTIERVYLLVCVLIKGKKSLVYKFKTDNKRNTSNFRKILYESTIETRMS